MNDRPTNKPTHDLTLISPPSAPGGRDTFTTICPAWMTQDGEGFSATIPAGLTLSGRILIQKRRDRAGEGAQTA